MFRNGFGQLKWWASCAVPEALGIYLGFSTAEAVGFLVPRPGALGLQPPPSQESGRDLACTHRLKVRSVWNPWRLPSPWRYISAES